MSLFKKTITKTKLPIKMVFLRWQRVVETTEDAECRYCLERKSALQPHWPCFRRSADGQAGAVVLQGGPEGSGSSTQGPDRITLGGPPCTCRSRGRCRSHTIEFSSLMYTAQLFLVYAPRCTPITTVSKNSRTFYHQPSGF